MSRYFVVFLALCTAAAVANGQAIRGELVDAANRPVPGVVVVLLDEASREVGRALSNERGEFRLRAATPGTYRVRTRRIGFRPMVFDPVALQAGGEVTSRLVLRGIPFSLDTIRTVTSGKDCRVVANDEGASTFLVWDQARTALAAAQLTASDRTIAATTLAYERTLDPGRRRILKQTTDVRSDFVAQPWRSLPSDSLRQNGYVVVEPGNVTAYRAPGIDALLSETFLEDHCLRRAETSSATQIGISFEPTAGRRQIAEIAGTVWLDARTSELQSLEFRYVNVSRDQENHAGGEMNFVRMKNGSWAISRWNIRMPVFVVALSGPTLAREELRVGSVRVIGGELVLAVSSSSRGRDTLWARQAIALRGTVLDSATGAPLRNARVSVSGTSLGGSTDAAGRFSISDLLPGRYILEVRTPSLDSVSTASQSLVVFTDSATSIELRAPTAAQVAASFCGAGNSDPASVNGIMLGRVVVAGDTIAPRGVKVVAQWEEIPPRGEIADMNRRTVESRTDSSGIFRLCGIPIGPRVTLRASTDSLASAPVSILIPRSARFAAATLRLDRLASAAASLRGIVSADSTDLPIIDAEVSFPDLGLATRTDGKGQFRLSGILPGNHRLLVRRLGFAALDTRIDLAAGQTHERKIVLEKVVSLDSVLTTAGRRDPGIESFAENRKMGLGHFVTRAQLAAREGALLSSFLQQTPGLRIISAGSQDWVVTARMPRSTCAGFAPRSAEMVIPCLERERLYFVPDRGDREQGMPIVCHPRVYLDNQLLNQGNPAAPIDLRNFPPTQVEALEFYAGVTQLPAKYQTDARCGVLVIHTRRPPG